MKKLFLVTLLCLTPLAYGVNIIIRDGETETTPIAISNDGDRVIIEKGGTLSTSTTAVTMSGDNEATLNSGTISTNGLSALGIFNSSGANATITNSGTISTAGVTSHGIFNQSGTNATITNSGTISTTGVASIGIFIETATNATITNSGTISTTDIDAHGIFNFFSDNATITNSGIISVTGTNADGIRILNSDNPHVINSGVIRSTQGFALNMNGTTAQTLTLLRGSNIQDGVHVTTSDLNLNVESGLNLALTLDPTSTTGFGAISISAPYAQLGNTIAVVDKTGLTLQADITADLSDTVLNSIYRFDRNPCGCGPWAQGLGSYRSRDEGHNTVGYDNWQGGFLLGYDLRNIGVFGGVVFGHAEVDANTQYADITSYLAGLSYEFCFCNSLVGAAITAGYVDWDNTRVVMNNLAPNGKEKARTSIDTAFVSSEVTLLRECFSLFNARLTGRYAGLFLGDYHEKGSLTNLSVKKREVDLITTRFELSKCLCRMLEPYVGLFGRFQVGGNSVKGELLGSDLYFSQGGPRNLGALLFGFRGNQTIGCLNAYINLEASFDTADSSRILGEGGIGWTY